MNKLLIIFLFASIALKSQWVIMPYDADSLALKGANFIYNVEFDSARSEFKELIRRYPEHPVGYFLDAMVDWWKITINRKEYSYAKQFLSNIETVIDRCDELLDDNPENLTALFFKGGALGYRGRYYAQNQEWLSAASDGKQAFEIMIECHIKAPGNHDIMLGSGIYNYFAQAIPERYPIVAPLLYFLPKGDKKIGILQLKASAEKGRYTAIEAEVVLMQTLYQFEHNYTDAQVWINSLRSKFPKNPYFHRYQARNYNRLGHWDLLEKEWREIVKFATERKLGYNNKMALEGCYYIGLALERKKDFENSLKYLRKSIEIGEFIDEEEESYFISAHLKIALIYDQTNRRDLAIKQYKRVLKMDDYQNSHEAAKKYLEKPYQR